MSRPSLTLILGAILMIYVCYSVYTLSKLFTTPQCTSTPCYTTILAKLPKLQLNLFVSPLSNPLTKDVTKIGAIEDFDYYKEFKRDFLINIPEKTYKNGTMYLHLVLVNDIGVKFEWRHLKREGLTILHRIPLTKYMVPKPATFNLLNANEKETTTSQNRKTVSHWKPKIYITMVTDKFSVSNQDIPPEMGRLIRITKDNDILPIVQNDFLKTRLSDLIELNSNTTNLPLTLTYTPISVGKLRLILHVEQALKSLKDYGFTIKDIDEVKGIFSEANFYLLCGTMFIGSIHLLFDFLSFKNDISFWRKKKSYVGLSLRTTLWRAFSQIVIFLYLVDEQTSLLVVIPAGIATVIELWKSKKILKLELSWSGIHIKSNSESKSIQEAERLTKEIDREGMRYLSYLLYPLVIAGAVYSLIYQPHKSWYSWTLNSLVNGVYAFGFLFMLPQLFVNYKLKSVAALPWRAFMYKAFNTFIDDVFAFIITMPTAHRIACFRDDIVFLIYLYQRWLYPVDKNRIDDGTGEFTQNEANKNVDQTKSKKNK